MFVPVKHTPGPNFIGWCVFDTETSSVLEYLGIFETVEECKQAIYNLEDEKNWEM